MSAETIKEMTDDEIYSFVMLYRGSLEKDLRRHRLAVIRIWFNLFPKRLWVSKKDLPMLYAWIERLENISIETKYKYAIGVPFKSDITNENTVQIPIPFTPSQAIQSAG